MTIKIEHGKPIPKAIKPGRPLDPINEAILKLGIGDSFKVKNDKKTRSNKHMFAKRHNVKITIRTLNSNHIRIWRVK